MTLPGTTLRSSSELTPSECSECGVAVVVGIQNVQRIGKRWVVWRECCKCFLANEKRVAGERAKRDTGTRESISPF